jgi:hypothetical protein
MARRGSVLIGVVVGALATMLLGGIAWAAIPGTPGGVIQGCYDSGGNVKVVEALPCPSKYTPFQWNQQGLAGTNGINGTNGVSPTVTQLAVGNVNCPSGGAAITDASNSTAYVCNGEAGMDGQAFAGSFTSPNGAYSISVSDAGITIAHGTSNSIKLIGDDVAVRSEDIDVKSSFSTKLDAGTTATIDATGNLSFTTQGSGLVHATGPLDLQGSVVNIN